MRYETLIQAIESIDAEIWKLVRKAGYIDKRDPLYEKRNSNHVLRLLIPVDNWALYDVSEDIHNEMDGHFIEKGKLVRYLNDVFPDRIPDQYKLMPRPQKQAWHARD